MNFRELIEGMNQNKQNGMMSKDAFEKHLKSGEHIQIGDDTISMNSDKEWMLNTTKSKFVKVYQMYRAAFKDGMITEGMDTDEMMELIGDLDSKGAQVAWNWFEDNLGDSGIYAGDAVPEDYLEIMSDKQIKTLFKLIKKYL